MNDSSLELWELRNKLVFFKVNAQVTFLKIYFNSVFEAYFLQHFLTTQWNHFFQQNSNKNIYDNNYAVFLDAKIPVHIFCNEMPMIYQYLMMYICIKLYLYKYIQ